MSEIEKNENIEKYSVQSFSEAVELVEFLKLIYPEDDLIVLTDFDGTITAGIRGKLVKVPDLDSLTDMDLAIPFSHILGLQRLKFVTEDKVAVVTNRKEEDEYEIWNSKELIETFRLKLAKNQCDIRIFFNMDRMLPQWIVNTYNPERYDNLIEWIYSKQSEKPTRIIVISDRDIASLTDKFFLKEVLERISSIGITKGMLIDIKSSLLYKLLP